MFWCWLFLTLDSSAIMSESFPVSHLHFTFTANMTSTLFTFFAVNRETVRDLTLPYHVQCMRSRCWTGWLVLLIVHLICSLCQQNTCIDRKEAKSSFVAAKGYQRPKYFHTESFTLKVLRRTPGFLRYSTEHEISLEYCTFFYRVVRKTLTC